MLSRAKAKGRRESGPFTAIPHAVQDSSNWQRCSGTAIKMVCDLARQYNGRNNGDLCAAFSALRRVGWSSQETVNYALRELRHYGLVSLTRQGGLHGPSLYALTWRAIDDCNGKLETVATAVASGDWKQPRERYTRPRRNRSASTSSVQDRYDIRSTPLRHPESLRRHP